MASLDYQMIRQAVREEFADLFGLPDEEEISECPDECPAMICIRDQRDVIRNQDSKIDRLMDEIAKLKAKVAEIEKRPIITAEPIVDRAFDHIYRPWNITYTRPE